MRVQTPGARASIALLLIATACSRPENTARPAGATSAAPQAIERTPCAMLTASQMSDIVGTAVTAESESGGGSTTCHYRPDGRTAPSVDVSIDWGGGRMAMMSSRMMSRLEPGIADRLAGIGDEASAVGPVLWVRTGDDLVSLTLWGVGDDVAAAKRIIGLLRPRMGPSAQAKAAGEADSAAEDAARAGQLVSGLLNRLAEQKDHQPQ
jgi:hypothetical protein